MTWSRLTFWVRALTRSSQCSTIARSGDRDIPPGNGQSVCSDPPTDTASASSLLRV